MSQREGFFENIGKKREIALWNNVTERCKVESRTQGNGFTLGVRMQRSRRNAQCHRDRFSEIDKQNGKEIHS